MEAERARQAEEEAQRQASLLHEALESLRSGDNPHLALHQLQLLHRLPLESVLSLQAQLCSCLHAVEQVILFTQAQANEAFTPAQPWHISKWANPDFSRVPAGPASELGEPRVCRVIS